MLLEALIAQRKRLGLSQDRVARKLGRIQQFVSKYESGERRLDVIEFMDVTRALDLNPLALLENIDRNSA